MFQQRRPLGRHRREHEPPVDRDPRDFRETELALVGPRIPLGERKVHQGPVVRECPGVIGASERGAVALVLNADRIAAMRAAVEKQLDLALAIADHDNRHRTDGFRHEVVGVGDLAGAADIDPGLEPDLLQLLLEDHFVVVE